MSDELTVTIEQPQGLLGRIAAGLVRLAQRIPTSPVKSVPVGRSNDGLIPYATTGTDLDRPWSELKSSLTDTREAWRRNPMVRRMVGMTTAYIVGPGISMSSENEKFNTFIDEFWNHKQNTMDIRIPTLADELSRAGELFITLHINVLDGMSYVRTVASDLIVDIDYDPNDYESELRFREYTPPGEDEKWWLSPLHPSANIPDSDGNLPPVMLHYAVNRPVGCIRGESDLSAILPWVKRYEGWLSDRVSLNAAMRSFYFVVYGARHIKNELISKYKSPPPKGSVIVAEEGAERWEAVTPQLGARDAKEDGRAIRWMVVAGGLGTALADLGEGEEAGLRGATDASEQRRRFLLQRQRYFVFLLSDLLVTAYNRRTHTRVKLAGGRKLSDVTVADVICKPPDISTDDNGTLAVAAKDMVTAATQLKGVVGDTPEFRQMTLKLFTKVLGETMTEKTFDAILKGDPVADSEMAAEGQAKIAAKYAPAPAPGAAKKPAAKKPAASGGSKSGK